MARALCDEDTHMEVEKVFRLGKKEGSVKPRLLLVRLNSQLNLRTCTEKGSSCLMSVLRIGTGYITWDLTPEE